jgi:preprotein translocase subunit SecG
MYTLLLVVHVFACIGLIALVLLQHGKGADAGAAFGSGASSTVFGSRGSASFLTRATAGLATVFFATSLTLAYLAAQRIERKSVTEVVEPAVPPAAEVPAEVPEAPSTPPGDLPALPK